MTPSPARSSYAQHFGGRDPLAEGQEPEWLAALRRQQERLGSPVKTVLTPTTDLPTTED